MRLLLLDTCGETGSLALAEDGAILRERSLPARAASAQLVRSIREELESINWPLRSLDAIGVVNGPGSFTGVRVGLAAAKGLCEVADLQLITVSRLAALLSIGESADDIAVLDAGRGEFYARAADGKEELLSRDGLLDQVRGRRAVIDEDRLLVPLEPLKPRAMKLSASSALTLVEEKLRQGVADSVEAADANYVRSARTLYAAAKKTPPQGRA